MSSTSSVREPRMARGVARRDALLDAAVRLLARDGVAALTHRSVAAEAGTTHGNARYYFGTLDQLLDEALRRLASRQIDEVRALFEELPDIDVAERVDRLASYVMDALTVDRDAAIARYELFLGAARRPELRASLDEWGATQRSAFAGELRGAGVADAEAAAADLLTAVNGLVLEHLALPVDDFEDARLRPLIARFFPQP
ncbi:TetR/AcrR family transcriptional regulator [Nocardioides sp. SLBN-35]|uniref:TetR/AcrR family transcriptional regulator n=1 Tax=Nocardioides sp. SLBN-35 TaxID=2768445 RepID=UPI001357A7C8|nr:TetR/AcrR family transcriptional regulator [Nocardioides sp. SLBN-35]